VTMTGTLVIQDLLGSAPTQHRHPSELEEWPTPLQIYPVIGLREDPRIGFLELRRT